MVKAYKQTSAHTACSVVIVKSRENSGCCFVRPVLYIIMNNAWILLGVCLVVQLFGGHVQAHPHRSVEDTEEDTSSESDQHMSHEVHPAHSEPEKESSYEQEMTSHEKSHEYDSNEEGQYRRAPARDSQQNSDEDDSVEYPRTEALCPARPEEITAIERECAKEYQLWKEQKARKEMAMIQTTTDEPQVESVSIVQTKLRPGPMKMSEELKVGDVIKNSAMTMTSTEEPSTTEEATTMEAMTSTMTTADDDMTTTTETEMTTEGATARTPVTVETLNAAVKHRRSVKRKRSCYPATCILKKLKLLDSMGQLNSKQIQKFAVNMTVDGSKNLEEKAVECVKEINDAMIDSSADIGKKVGCVAYKVITCLNKGLICPIIKMPHT